MAEIVRRRSWGGVLPFGRHVSISGSRSIHAPSVSIAPSSFQEEQNARHHKQFKLEQALVLPRHERVWCGGLRKWVAQHGHLSRLWARATVSLRRMVAIEFGTCRSGRIGGAAGSITRGKANRFELRGGRS